MSDGDLKQKLHMIRTSLKRGEVPTLGTAHELCDTVESLLRRVHEANALAANTDSENKRLRDRLDGMKVRVLARVEAVFVGE